MGTTDINAFWQGWAESQLARVVIRRTPLSYPSLEELTLGCDELCNWLDQFDRTQTDLLCDMRDGPSRNDDAFESAMATYRVRMQRGFRRVAVIVSTPAGRLQIQRLAVTDRMTTLRVFLDEAEAKRHLSNA